MALVDAAHESTRVSQSVGAIARRTPQSIPRHAVVNREFHARISDAAHNRYLHRALAQMSDSLLLVPGTTVRFTQAPS